MPRMKKKVSYIIKVNNIALVVKKANDLSLFLTASIYTDMEEIAYGIKKNKNPNAANTNFAFGILDRTSSRDINTVK